MSAAPTPWLERPDGLQLRVKVRPKSRREVVGGIEETAQGPAIGINVRAAPIDGEANTAVLTLLAHWLGVARSSLMLKAGASGRIKSVLVLGEPAKLRGLVLDRLREECATKGEKRKA